MWKLFGAHKPSVLVVDADDDTRALYRVVLGGLAGTIDEACDGIEAFGLASSRPPDLLVTERRLPRMDGVTLAERVRALPRGRDCAVLMVTSGLSDAERDRLLALGIEEILYKPCDMGSFRAAAQRLTWRVCSSNPDGLTGGLAHRATAADRPREPAPRRSPR